jgi:2-oxoglutarate/2-oxoacid ferredoxin oxidoreductase subunit beta
LAASIPLTAKDFKSDVHIDWCPGCGDFAIVTALQMAMAEIGLPPHKWAIVSGVGCSAKTPHYLKAYGAHTIHGRLLPYAIGVKLSNPDLTVVGVGGDGDGLGIGAGHFVNAGRRNVDLTYLFFNNGVYGLTKGQASPTLKLGAKPKSLPSPNINEGINPLWVAIAAGYTWVGRTYSFDVKHMKEMIVKAVRHKGLAFLDILQPCPTYNDLQTKDWYSAKDAKDPASGEAGQRLYRLETRGHNPTVRAAEEQDAKMLKAIELAAEWGDRIPIGVFYENPLVSTFEERIANRTPSYLGAPPGRQRLADAEGKSMVKFDELVKGLRL